MTKPLRRCIDFKKCMQKGRRITNYLRRLELKESMKDKNVQLIIMVVFYQRLKHMVSDKQHSRSIGPMVNLTRQPAEGRSRDGGFRIGEMERDVMIAHGMTRFCKERMYDVSDKYNVYVCKKCGLIASYNDGKKNKMYTKRIAKPKSTKKYLKIRQLSFKT